MSNYLSSAGMQDTLFLSLRPLERTIRQAKGKQGLVSLASSTSH